MINYASAAAAEKIWMKLGMMRLGLHKVLNYVWTFYPRNWLVG